jgi:hypothetical protein
MKQMSTVGPVEEAEVLVAKTLGFLRNPASIVH